MPHSILIADDSVTIRRVVELAFSDTGIRVEAAGTGAEALAKIAALAPDVVLADVVMPAPDGYEICRLVKASDRPVPVLLLAGTFEPLDPERAALCGADGHLVKPFDSRILVAQVARLLDGGPARLAAPDAVAAVWAPTSDEDDLDDVFDDLAGIPVPFRHQPRDAREAVAYPDTGPPRTGGASAAAGAVAPAAVSALDGAAIDAIVARVLERLSDRVVREIAWDVVPDLAETIIRERLRELESDDEVD